MVTAIAFFPAVAFILECLRDDLADGLRGRLARRLFAIDTDARHAQMQGDCLQRLIGPFLSLGLGRRQGRRSLCILDMPHHDGFQGLRFMRRLEADPLDLEPSACRFAVSALV